MVRIFFRDAPRGTWDFIYADAWPGKFSFCTRPCHCCAPAVIYFIDNLRPQPNWPDGHGLKVAALIEALGRFRVGDRKPGLRVQD